SRALAESLAHLAESERISPQYRVIATQLAKRAERIKTHAKLDVLTKLLKETPDRVVVFSDHRPTIQLIEERVKQLNRKPIVYWGAHSTADRDKRIRAFHDDERSVLIATRAGSEGRNLQFCNVLVNYDLPWNPMVVEQRIGRLHRIGQTREVHIVNLAAAGTIESYILQLLDQKIKLFELVVGELDLILGEFGGAQEFEGRLAKEWLAAESEEDFARRVETMGVEIEKSSAAGKEQEELNSLIAPDDNAMRLERRFETLSVRGRLRLGLGTSQVVKTTRWETKRHRLGVHVTELLEALESIEPIGGVTTEQQPAGTHPVNGHAEIADADPLAEARIRPLLERYCVLAGVKQTALGPDHSKLSLPQAERPFFKDREGLSVAFSLDALERDPDAEIAVLGSPFLSQLIEAIRTRAARLSLGLLAPASASSPLSRRERGTGGEDGRERGDDGVDLPIPVRDGIVKSSKGKLAVHPVGRLVARVVLRAGAGVEEAVVESDVYDLATGARLSDDLAGAFRD